MKDTSKYILKGNIQDDILSEIFNITDLKHKKAKILFK